MTELKSLGNCTRRAEEGGVTGRVGVGVTKSLFSWGWGCGGRNQRLSYQEGAENGCLQRRETGEGSPHRAT